MNERRGHETVLTALAGAAFAPVALVVVCGALLIMLAAGVPICRET